ncbi:unnamed protein product, partial [Ectocarpus sp. 4 AP-2014]
MPSTAGCSAALAPPSRFWSLPSLLGVMMVAWYSSGLKATPLTPAPYCPPP